MMRWILGLALSALLSPLALAAEGADASKFHKPEEDKSLRFVPMEPNIITNFSRKDSKKLGVLQAQVQLTTKTNEGVDVLVENLPLLRDRLIILLSSETEDQVKDPAAREALKQTALAELRKLLKDEGAKDDTLNGILFTGFMYQ